MDVNGPTAGLQILCKLFTWKSGQAYTPSHCQNLSLLRFGAIPPAFLTEIIIPLQILSQPGVLTRGQAAKAGVVLDAQVLKHAHVQYLPESTTELPFSSYCYDSNFAPIVADGCVGNEHLWASLAKGVPKPAVLAS